MTIKKSAILENLVWVTLNEYDDFLKIKETLTRIGISSKSDKTLYQSCHILHKQGRYAIVHFKELFLLDGKPSDFTEEDKARRNTIADLLAQWHLLTIVDKKAIEEPQAPVSQIKIIPFKEKNQWTLIPKYAIGRKINNDTTSDTSNNRDNRS